MSLAEVALRFRVADDSQLPLSRHAYPQGLTIEGYSRAAVQTYWRIPELKIGFDLGAQPWSFMGTADLVRLAHAPGPHRGPAGLRGPAADDEDGAAGDLSARGGHRARCSRSCKLFTRLDRGRLPCELLPIAAGRRDRAVARARGDGLGHEAHGAVAGLRRLGAAAEAQARVSRTCPASRFATCGLAGTEVTAGTAHAAAGLPGRQLAGRARRLPGHVRGQGADHGDDVRGPVAPQGQDPQVRPHAPGRLRRAPRPVSRTS